MFQVNPLLDKSKKLKCRLLQFLFGALRVNQLDLGTEEPRYNDSVCYQRFFCKIEFAVIKKLDLGPCKAWITDIFEVFFFI